MASSSSPVTSLNATTPSVSDAAADGDWPLYTSLVYVPGKEPALGHQSHEVQVVVRKAFDIIGEKIIFQNSFLSLAERAVWHRTALRAACCYIFEGSSALVRQRYARLWRRLTDDCTFVRILSKLVSRFAYILINLIINLG
jgi:hypothetical protein